MKDRFAVTIHLTNAAREAITKAASLYGVSLKTFIENTLPYVAAQINDNHKVKTAKKVEEQDDAGNNA